jgi:hypothetical protein
VCHRFDEDGGQLFFKCKAMNRIWTELYLERLGTISSAKEIVEIILGLEEQKEMKCILCFSGQVEGE